MFIACYSSVRIISYPIAQRPTRWWILNATITNTESCGHVIPNDENAERSHTILNRIEFSRLKRKMNFTIIIVQMDHINAY